MESFRLEAGDAVFFRDEEVLHGRRDFAAEQSGDRLLWKTYFMPSAEAAYSARSAPGVRPLGRRAERAGLRHDAADGAEVRRRQRPGPAAPPVRPQRDQLPRLRTNTTLRLRLRAMAALRRARPAAPVELVAKIASPHFDETGFSAERLRERIDALLLRLPGRARRCGAVDGAPYAQRGCAAPGDPAAGSPRSGRGGGAAEGGRQDRRVRRLPLQRALSPRRPAGDVRRWAGRLPQSP